MIISSTPRLGFAIAAKSSSPPIAWPSLGRHERPRSRTRQGEVQVVRCRNARSQRALIDTACVASMRFSASTPVLQGRRHPAGCPFTAYRCGPLFNSLPPNWHLASAWAISGAAGRPGDDVRQRPHLSVSSRNTAGRSRCTSFEQHPQSDHRRALQGGDSCRAPMDGLSTSSAGDQPARTCAGSTALVSCRVTTISPILPGAQPKRRAAVIRYGARMVVIDPWNRPMTRRYEPHRIHRQAARRPARPAKALDVHVTVVAHPDEAHCRRKARPLRFRQRALGEQTGCQDCGLEAQPESERAEVTIVKSVPTDQSTGR